MYFVNGMDFIKEEGGAESILCWILLGFEWRHWKEGQTLGGGAHQGQSAWSKTTGATDLSEKLQKIKDSPSKPLQEIKDMYQSPYLEDAMIASPSYQSSRRKKQDQDNKSNFGLQRSSVKNLYQILFLKDSLSEYATSHSKKHISTLKDLREEREKASNMKVEVAERLKVLRSLKKEAEDDLFDLVSRKTSMSRRTSVARSPLPTRMPSIRAGTEHEELMRYIPQPLQRLIEKIDIPSKDGDCGYTCVVWSSGQGRGILPAELIRKHISTELKKDKKIYEMIEGRNIDEDIQNTQAGKSAGVAGWLKMPLFGYAIANHLRRPLYYFSLDFMHTYPTNCSYSSYPPFCMAFVDINHYLVLRFKNVNGSIPASPIDVWWLRECSLRNKKLWLQSLENDLKFFQKLMPLLFI
ncbi:hypothetical protein PPACK8108_LOCUS8568 [Phakopsora pachyrhizi]|uniref:OTU domain-containing protein n=1 Tax=Phakopsora pachyrhizi TaxID=170000 RepID=A0AAV0AZG4_PHAPC|nr:hypothetical protein PPACK8108_LOCUS8568 [Phakopsora pachyrhizi]